MNFFPDGYEPTSKDILCGRGKGNLRHEGNQYFMKIIRANLQRYTDAPKRIDKSLVVSLIVSSLKDEGYKFVRQDTKSRRWFQLSEPQIHEKTGHAIRDILKKGGGPQPSSQSKQAISANTGFEPFPPDEPDLVASQILSTALKVSKLVEKSKIDFAALSNGQSIPPSFVAPAPPQTNSRTYRRSSIVRLFDGLSPEEPMSNSMNTSISINTNTSATHSMNDQPLPIEAHNSGALRTSDMMQVFESLTRPSNEPPPYEEESEEFISPNSRKFGSSSREFRRSELLQFLEFSPEELMAIDDTKSPSVTTATTAAPAPAAVDQPLPMDTRTSDTLNALFKDQEEIFSNLQHVFGTLPDDEKTTQNINPAELEKRTSRASQVLTDLLHRQEGLFEELQKFEAEYDVGDL